MQKVTVIPPQVPYTYDAKLIKVVDGDTVRLEVFRVFDFVVDFGFHQQETVTIARSAIETFRLRRINCPEPGTQAGKDAREALALLISGKKLVAKTSKPDKFGRWLVELYLVLPDQPDMNVNDWMVTNNYAVPYMVPRDTNG